MHTQPATRPTTIRAADLSLVLAYAKLRRHNHGRTCATCALTPAPLLEIDCHTRAPSKAWREQVQRTGGTWAHVGPMQRGHISTLYERVRLRQGLAEVRRTWGTGLRALRAEPRHVLNGGAQ